MRPPSSREAFVGAIPCSSPRLYFWSCRSLLELQACGFWCVHPILNERCKSPRGRALTRRVLPSLNVSPTLMLSAMMIGIISDTHGLLRPEASARLAGVDHIIHAGDIGRPEVIAGLRELAPTTAIRGNIDTGRRRQGDPATPPRTLRGRA